MTTTNKKDIIINASEFCSILNSDDDPDPAIIMKTFKRFLRTVRLQQRQSSSSSNGPTIIADAANNNDLLQLPQEQADDEDDDEEMEVDDQSVDEEEDEEDKSQQKEQPRRKKFKKTDHHAEAWKADTADYNVPFVGTAAVASHGQPDPIQVGEWPTGLLQAYIAKSPLAVELFPNNNHHKDYSSTTTGGSGSGLGRFLPHQKWYKKLQQQKRHEFLADKIVNAYWQILTLLVPYNARLVQQFTNNMTIFLADVVFPLLKQPAALSKYAASVVPFLTALAVARRPAARLIARELMGDNNGGMLVQKLFLPNKSSVDDAAVVATAAVRLVVALRHDGILAVAFPAAALRQQNHGMVPFIVGDLIEYVVEHLHRSWFFFTRDVLKALCKLHDDPRRKEGRIVVGSLLKALATNVHQSPLYARKSNEPLLLRLVAQHLLPDVEIVRTLLLHRPRCLAQLYEELPALPDHATRPMRYIATLRTLTVLCKEYADSCDLPKTFRRPQILKAINSANPLVAYQTLVYLSAVLDNFHAHASLDRKEAFLAALPDASTMVNVAIAKYPSDSSKSSGLLRAFAGAMVAKQLQLVPRKSDSSSLDLTKLLPKTTSEFEKMAPALQLMIVRGLRGSLEATTVRVPNEPHDAAAHHVSNPFSDGLSVACVGTKAGSSGVDQAIQGSHGTVVCGSSS